MYEAVSKSFRAESITK